MSGVRTSTLRDGGQADVLLAAVLSDDGTLAFVGSSHGTLTIWKRTDARAPKGARWTLRTAIAIPYDDEINSVALSDDGRVVATATEGGRLWLWAVPNGAPRGEIANAGLGALTSVQFDPRDPTRMVASGDSGCARLLSAVTFGPVGRSMCDGSSGMGAATFSPSGQQIVTGSDNGAQVWNARTQKRTGKPFDNYTGDMIESIAFNRDGSRLALAYGSTVYVYKAN